MTDWHEAYAKWLPDAISSGRKEVNDAFRAGFLAATGETDLLLAKGRLIIQSLLRESLNGGCTEHMTRGVAEKWCNDAGGMT